MREPSPIELDLLLGQIVREALAHRPSAERMVEIPRRPAACWRSVESLLAAPDLPRPIKPGEDTAG